MRDGACCPSSDALCGDAATISHTALNKPLLESGSFGVLAFATSPEPDRICSWGTFNSSNTIHHWLKRHNYAAPPPKWRPVLYVRHSSQWRVAAVIKCLFTAGQDGPLSVAQLMQQALDLQPGSDNGLVSEVLTCLAGIGLLSFNVFGGQSHKKDLFIG